MERATGGSEAPSARSGSSAAPPAAGHGFLHSAVVVPTREQTVAATLSFVEEGLRAGDLTVLACSPDTVDGIGRALGLRASSVRADYFARFYGVRPPDVMAGFRGLAAEAAAGRTGRARVLAEVPVSREPRDWFEGRRTESATNAVLGRCPLTVLCVYDRSRHDEGLLDSVRDTHPLVVENGLARPNAEFREPRSYLRGLPVPREPVESAPPVFTTDGAPGLAQLRHAVGAVLEAWVPDEEQRGDLHLAVSEVAANAFRHGTRPVSARVWADGARLVCTITDTGRRFDDPLAGYVPAHGDDLGRGGMGLWLARKLFDSVDLLPTEAGFTVRLSATLRRTVRSGP